METEQSSSNRSLKETEVQPQQVSPENSRAFLVVIVSVILTAVVAGSAVYFWQKSSNEKVIDNLEQKISFLEEQASTIKKVEISPQPTSLPMLSPTPTTDPTAKWKTYSSGNISFRYPPNLYLDTVSGQYPTIYSDNPQENKDAFYLSFSIDMNETFINYIKKQSGFNNISYDSKKIGSYSGYQVTGEPAPGGVSEEIYYVETNSNLVRIAIGNIPKDKDSTTEFQQFYATVDQVFSTLKFNFTNQ